MSVGGSSGGAVGVATFVEFAEAPIGWDGRCLWCGGDTEPPFLFCSPGCRLGYARRPFEHQGCGLSEPSCCPDHRLLKGLEVAPLGGVCPECGGVAR
jgi:hypothetical protein